MDPVVLAWTLERRFSSTSQWFSGSSLQLGRFSRLGAVSLPTHHTADLQWKHHTRSIGAVPSDEIGTQEGHQSATLSSEGQ